MEITQSPANAVKSLGEWMDLLRLGACEVFETMIGGTRLTVDENAEPLTSSGVAAMVGYAGPLTGVFVIRCSENAAAVIASRMLGLPAEEAAKEMWDAMGEVCNMVSGNFKSKIGEAGEKTMLSVPTVVAGKAFKLRSLANGITLEALMRFDEELISFRLELHG